MFWMVHFIVIYFYTAMLVTRSHVLSIIGQTSWLFCLLQRNTHFLKTMLFVCIVMGISVQKGIFDLSGVEMGVPMVTDPMEPVLLIGPYSDVRAWGEKDQGLTKLYKSRPWSYRVGECQFVLLPLIPSLFLNFFSVNKMIVTIITSLWRILLCNIKKMKYNWVLFVFFVSCVQDVSVAKI